MYNKLKKVSEKTIERFSLYRRKLISQSEHKDCIFSKELAKLSNSSAYQVRRDLMHLGCTGIPRIGYNIKLLIECIDKFLDPNKIENAIIVGVGDLGRSLVKLLQKKNLKISVVACIDINEELVGKEISGIFCYHLNDMKKVIEKYNATIGVISSNERSTELISEIMIDSGIRSIINFTGHTLNISDIKEVFVEQIDITASFEKAAYLSKSLDK